MLTAAREQRLGATALRQFDVMYDEAGVPEDDRERIFEPYASAHGVAGHPGSIGLGLAISRKLARLMGGDLTYRYQDGESVFEFTLPVPD